MRCCSVQVPVGSEVSEIATKKSLSGEPEEALKAYAGLYVREEVQFEGLARRMSSFARFLEAISFSHGAQINLSDVSRECETPRATVDGYLAILEDLLLAYLLPVFTRRAKRQVASHPKFYWFDVGLFANPRGEHEAGS